MASMKTKAIAEGYGLIRAGIVAARKDAATYGLPVPLGRDAAGFSGRPYGYAYVTELWLSAYNQEFDKALGRRMASLSATQVQQLTEQHRKNATIRKAKDPALTAEVMVLRERVQVLETK